MESQTKDFLVDASGQYFSIFSVDPVYLDYVAVFLFPCTLDCSSAFLASQVYYYRETTILTIPACTGSSATTQATLSSSPASNFATLKKNADNTFNIAFVSSDLSLVGQTFVLT